MTVFVSLNNIWQQRPTVVTIGVFDGVHRGHQWLIANAAQVASKYRAEVSVVTFWPPPAVVLHPQTPPRCLMLRDEKLEALRLLPQVRHVIALPFTPELAQQSAEAFMHDLLTHIPIVAIVEGEDFTLGHDRQGTIAWLHDYGATHGFAVPPVTRRLADDQPISSTRIRDLIADGEVAEAALLLGKPYQLAGEVVHGDARGRDLGFPTANLRIDPWKLIPANGIYAVRTWSATAPQDVWSGAASIGIRPTFGGTTRLVEVHILDFNADLYGQILHVEVIQRIREERRFATAAELIAQMTDDVITARQLLDLNKEMGAR